MKKSKLKVLERLFEADMKEIPIYQRRSKHIEELEAEGLAQRIEIRLGGRFPVTIKGWRISPAGHMTYCAWAANQS